MKSRLNALVAAIEIAGAASRGRFAPESDTSSDRSCRRPILRRLVDIVDRTSLISVVMLFLTFSSSEAKSRMASLPKGSIEHDESVPNLVKVSGLGRALGPCDSFAQATREAPRHAT